MEHRSRTARLALAAPAVVLAATALVAVLPAASTAQPAPVQAPPASRPIGPLTNLRPLGPPQQAYDAIVRNNAALVALGKALFWDVRVSWDDRGGMANNTNNQACASCHFHAGADTRTANQLSPGLNVQPAPDLAFGGAAGKMGGGGPAGPNVALAPADFPFHRLADANNRESAVLFDTNDAVSSQGSFRGALLGQASAAQPSGSGRCAPEPKPPFMIEVGAPAGAGTAQPQVQPGAGQQRASTRQVPPRNSPTTINSAFMHRSFWDGRANNVFNGVNPFGRRAVAADPAARVYKTDGAAITPQALALENMNAASQAVGPVLSDVEMTCAGRAFADVGRRVMGQVVLRDQAVAPDDSAFSAVSAAAVAAADAASSAVARPAEAVDAADAAVAPDSIVSRTRGLRVTYRALARAAFQPAYWRDERFWAVDPATGRVSPAPDQNGGHRLDELNFSLFFGMAIDAYERTLVSDRSPFDAGSLSDDARAGRAIFEGKGKCAACHDGPLFSAAATWQGDSAFTPVERMAMADGRAALYDNGFYNIGVRPTFEDAGLGNTDPYGNPLSFTRQFVLDPRTAKIGADGFPLDPCRLEIPFDAANCAAVPNAAEARSLRVAVDGAFKTPTLRNVGLTAPYFHNGGQKSLAEVVAFYNRGGDRRSVPGGDTTGTGPLGRPVVVGVSTAAVAAAASASPAAAARAPALPAAASAQAVVAVDPATGIPISPGMGGSNADPDVTGLGLSVQQQAQLVEFLKALTDRRVACHAAPFDHPELPVLPNGHPPRDSNGDGNADDTPHTLRRAGASGYANCDEAAFGRLNSGDLFVSSPAFGAMALGAAAK